MKISVIGCGYLGAVHAASMAELGHDVIGVDIEQERINLLSRGIAPFYEKGFADMLARNVASERLTFTTDYAKVSDAQVHFICVGTPQSESGYSGDLSYINSAVDSLLSTLPARSDDPILIVGKSTVPVGTAEPMARRFAKKNALLVWNPEFLREGHAIQDTISPDRIVYGLPPDPEAALLGQNRLDEVYQNLIDEQKIPRLLTDYATSELVKVAANSFLATKISFINAMAELCEATGADVTELAEAIGYDERIGSKFLRAGVGFGGGCLPKDIRAFMARAGELGAEQALTFLREVDAINNRRRDHVVQLALQALDGNASGKKVAVLGAAFKPETDDTRDSPALDIAERLYGSGAQIQVVDPQAGKHVRRERPHLQVVDSAEVAMRGADVVLLLTEWDEFKNLNPHNMVHLPTKPMIIDGRNVLDPAVWREAGWHYRGIGRP